MKEFEPQPRQPTTSDMDYVDGLITLMKNSNNGNGSGDKDLLVWTARKALRGLTNPQAKEKLEAELKKYES